MATPLTTPSPTPNVASPIPGFQTPEGGIVAGPTLTAGPVAPSVALKPPSAVVSSKTAVSDLNKKQTEINGVDASIKAQAEKVASDKLVAEAKASQTLDQQKADKLAEMKAQTDLQAAQAKNRSFADITGGMTTDANGNLIPKPEVGTTPAPTDTYTTDVQNNIDALQKQYDDTKAKVDQITSGKFPLTGEQQAMIDAVKAQLEETKQSQLLANKNYEGAITQAGISSGRNRYAPEIEAGNIANAVNVGIKKIADLDNEAAMTIAKLQQGFKQDDYKMVQDEYARYGQLMEAKNKAITDIHSATVDAAKAAKADIQQSFENKLKSDNYSLDQKKETFDEIMKSDQLTLDQKKQAETEWKDQQEIALKKQAADPYSGALTGINGSVPVTVTATGEPNQLEQKAFLDKLPQTAQTFVKGLTDYTTNPANLSARQPAGGGMSDREKYLALAHQYDPSFDESQFAARALFNKDWTSGQLQNNRLAINTGVNHLQELSQAASALENKNFKSGFGPFTQKYNTIADLIKAHSGDPSVSAYNAAANKVATELAKIYKGNASPTDAEIADERKNLDLGLSPDQLGAVIGTSVNLIAGRLQPMLEQYQSTMGKAPTDSVIGDSARQSIIKMREAGTNIDISRLDPGNEWRYMDPKEYLGNNPGQKDLATSIVKANPGISDTALIDTLHSVQQNQSTFSQPLSMGENGSEVKKIASAIGKFESGGNYNAIGPKTSSGDNAYGKYQIMGANIPSWTKEALGKSLTIDQFKNDPQAQDKVAEYKMNQYYNKFGTLEDVASAWFSGQPLAKAGNVKDVIGTSVPKYVTNIRSIYDNLG